MITIGSRSELAVGQLVQRLWSRRRLVSQPCRVIGPSTLEAWVESHIEIYGEPPTDADLESAQRGDAKFYLVSTD